MSYPPPPYPPQAYGPVPLRPDQERTWAILAHLLGLFAGFLAPLIIWLVFRGRGPYLEDQAKEALNFQLTLLIAYVVGIALALISLGILAPVVIAIPIGQIVFEILAAVAANRFQWYRYPLTIRFVR